jgi:N-acetylglucosamine kinase-like BadF-type ATPase
MPSSRRNKARISRDLFLGVDGGGTKTLAMICGADGKALSEFRSGPSNPLRTGINQSVASIAEAVSGACDAIGRTPDDIVCAVAGLAGARRYDIRRQMEAGISGIVRRARVEVITDADIALYATTEGKPGLVVISGTGSVCFGRNKKGETAVAGGWGPIAGDEGGGSSIARDALKAVARASDGRGGPTVLSGLAAEYFRAPSPEDLIVAIYSPSTDHRKLAGFARCVIEAARDGDEIAGGILADAGQQLGKAACAVIKTLGMERSRFPIGMVGGIFAAGDLISEPLMNAVRSCAGSVRASQAKMSPAEAAARMAINAFYQSPSL